MAKQSTRAREAREQRPLHEVLKEVGYKVLDNSEKDLLLTDVETSDKENIYLQPAFDRSTKEHVVVKLFKNENGHQITTKIHSIVADVQEEFRTSFHILRLNTSDPVRFDNNYGIVQHPRWSGKNDRRTFRPPTVE